MLGVDGTNEIDIEFARWGNPKWPNGNFTVWPPVKDAKNGSDTFNFSLNKREETTHRFAWTSRSLEFESRTGAGDKRSESIHKWLYMPEDFMSRIPQNPEPVLMNLWLFRGKPPTDGKEVEIVVKRFKFTSLPAPGRCCFQQPLFTPRCTGTYGGTPPAATFRRCSLPQRRIRFPGHTRRSELFDLSDDS